MEKTIIIGIAILLFIPTVLAQGFGHCPFGNYPFGNCVIAEEELIGEGEGTGPGGASTIGFPTKEEDKEIKRYDLLIELDKDVYLFGETVKATITIINKGDIPDEDTVLTFWLANPINRMFGETREQFLEIPIGKSVFNKNITIPEDDLSGEWRFKLKYFTSFQPTIEAYRSFEVKEELNIIDKIRNIDDNKTMIGWIVVMVAVFVVVQYIARKDYLKKQDIIPPKENE